MNHVDEQFFAWLPHTSFIENIADKLLQLLNKKH